MRQNIVVWKSMDALAIGQPTWSFTTPYELPVASLTSVTCHHSYVALITAAKCPEYPNVQVKLNSD